MQPKHATSLISGGLLLCGLYFGAFFWLRSTGNSAYDYAINWTAAKALTAGSSVYAREQLRSMAVNLVGPYMGFAFSGLYDSYIGAPTTALFFVPFTIWDYPTSLIVYRVLSLIAFGLAVVFAGLTLPIETRKWGWCLGLFALLIWDPIQTSLQLGQLDAWIALALAISLWLMKAGKWKLAGIGIGIASLLKISPALLIVYCVLKKKWLTAITATLTIVVGVLTSILVSGFNDWQAFAVSILPSLSNATVNAQNQSLPAYLARLLLPEVNFINYSIGLGNYRFLSVIIALGLMAWLWRKTSHKPFASAELGLIVLVALLAGPLTWDHYISWAIVPVVQMGNSGQLSMWKPRQRLELIIILLIGMFLLIVPTLYYPPAAIAAQGWLRFETGLKTICLLILFGVGAGVILTDSPASPQPQM